MLPSSCCPGQARYGPSTGGVSMGFLTRGEILILTVGTAILEAPLVAITLLVTLAG